MMGNATNANALSRRQNDLLMAELISHSQQSQRFDPAMAMSMRPTSEDNASILQQFLACQQQANTNSNGNSSGSNNNNLFALQSAQNVLRQARQGAGFSGMSPANAAASAAVGIRAPSNNSHQFNKMTFNSQMNLLNSLANNGTSPTGQPHSNLSQSLLGSALNNSSHVNANSINQYQLLAARHANNGLFQNNKMDLPASPSCPSPMMAASINNNNNSIIMNAAPPKIAHEDDPGWEEQYRALLSHHRQFGNCKVPARFKGNPKLGRWVMTQRRQFTLMAQGFPNALTAHRIQRLEAIGFTWSIRPEPVSLWNKKLQELKAYKAAFGNCMVPQRYQANTQLGTWVHTQRRQYKLMKEGKKSSMTKEKVQALDSIGFFWAAKQNDCAGSGNEGDASSLQGSKNGSETLVAKA